MGIGLFALRFCVVVVFGKFEEEFYVLWCYRMTPQNSHIELLLCSLLLTNLTPKHATPACSLVPRFYS